MKLARLLLVALLISATMDAGCVGFIRDAYKDISSTPVPSATLPATVTPVPINQTIERQYMFADTLNSGLGYYNSGIMAGTASIAAAKASDWDNASIDIGIARTYMEQARAAFMSMKTYATTPDEAGLADKWNETAYYQIQAFDFMNQSFQEDAYQSTRGDQANPVKSNYYITQANAYIEMAKASKAEAEVLERKTFIGQQGQVV